MASRCHSHTRRRRDEVNYKRRVEKWHPYTEIETTHEPSSHPFILYTSTLSHASLVGGRYSIP